VNRWNAVTGSVRYGAWGEERASTGTMPTDRGYTGQLEADEVGLYFYNARWYDAELARFAEADSIVPDPGSAVAYDRYAYSLNNPIRYNDPSGHYGHEGGIPTTIPYLVGYIAVTGFAGGAAIYEYNVSGNSWWESADDAVETLQAGVEGSLLSVGLALSAGTAALMLPDTAMYFGSQTGNSRLFNWGVTQSSWLNSADASAFIPNPNGRKGGLQHQEVANSINRDFVNRYYGRDFQIRSEYRVQTPGGMLSSRFMDRAVIDPNGDPVAFYQVGLVVLSLNNKII